MTVMISKVIQTINRYEMLHNADKVYVALSGGADSMALLHVLKALSYRYGIQLSALHVNHGIRGVKQTVMKISSEIFVWNGIFRFFVNTLMFRIFHG
ncbi:MAG: hypothetical protein IKI29_05540 [Clostridia bacterium]|nr:hypothetical protein [Clostridia bacterium]